MQLKAHFRLRGNGLFFIDSFERMGGNLTDQVGIP